MAGKDENPSEDIQAELRRIHDRMDEIWMTMGTIAGLDGVAAGVAQVAEILAPLKNLVPPTVFGEVPQATWEAIARIRTALGPRPPIVDRLPVPDLPVPFIGQPREVVYRGQHQTGLTGLSRRQDDNEGDRP